MDSWFLSAVKKSPGSETKMAEDPLRKVFLGTLRNIPTQMICIVLVIVQATLLNHHLVKSYNNSWMYFWFVADAVNVACFITSFYLKEWRLKHVSQSHKDESEFSKGLPYASVAWLIYSGLLGARVLDIFINDLEHKADIIDLKSIICGTVIICIFFTWGHHHQRESLARRAAIMSLVKLFTIDVLDTVDILDVLFEIEEGHSNVSKAVEFSVLAVVAINLVRPSVALASLFFDHYSRHATALWVKILKTLYELLILNLPLLAIRVYLASTYHETISVFLVKNILGIFFGLVEIYDCSYDIYCERKTRRKTFIEMDAEEEATKKLGDSDETDSETS